MSFHYSSEKNEQSHAGGKNQKSRIVKLGFDILMENKHFYE